VVSSSDVALYATLTSLATLDRKGVRSMLVDNPHIRQFMDYGSTAYTKELVHSYLHARYKDVSRILKENRVSHQLSMLIRHKSSNSMLMQERHLVDPFLRPNVALLEDAIWQNSLVQYLQPFANAEFSRMAEAFGIEDPEAKANIIAKVGELVNRERLQAKLDMVAEVRPYVRSAWLHHGFNCASGCSYA
jgi:COP9 signalosome complex subunit 1